MPDIVTQQIPLAPLTTLGIGGCASFFARVTTEDELLSVITWAKSAHQPVTILGEGSNVLIADEGILGVVIQMGTYGIEFTRESQETVLVTADAGVSWDTLVRESVNRELFGLQNLSGIPGTVGAAPIQNINAYGVSCAESIVEVRALHRTHGTAAVFSQEACLFGYRDSFFKSKEGNEYIVTQVIFRLSTRPFTNTEYRSASQSIARYLTEHSITNPKPIDIRNAVLAVRENIGMLRGMYASAGSFFKNVVLTRDAFEELKPRIEKQFKDQSVRYAPWYWEQTDGTIKVSTAFLMECTPYNKHTFSGKMYRGTVGISPLHTLSIVNYNNATADDVTAFVKEITRAVYEATGVLIESEVCML